MNVLHYRIQSSARTIGLSFGAGALQELPKILREKMPAHRYVIITDSNVEKLYGKDLAAKLQKEGFLIEMLSFPAGENSKNEATKQKLDHALLQKNIGRDSALLALGGGVVGDLTGFVAATYLRGIPYIQIPTTVLAMADSSIGGKVGIDTPYGKNLIGAFWHPEWIIADTETLNTLDETEKINGWFEAIKMFACLDKATFEIAKKGFQPELIQRAMELKMQIVEKDERESGLRAVLNFGHSVGHALEHLSQYKIPHGYAVGLGMLVESSVAKETGLLSPADFWELQSVLNQLGAKTDAIAFSAEEIWEALANDKKNRADTVRFVALKTIGEVAQQNGSISTSLSKEEFLKGWAALFNQTH